MTAQRIRSNWLKFTEETNALDYLERAVEFIRQAEATPSAWKWVILALHGALYGFAIAACKGTDYQTVVRKTKKGVEHLISFDEALEMCADAAWMGSLHGGLALRLTVSQKNSIRQLKKRNRKRVPPLVHFN